MADTVHLLSEDSISQLPGELALHLLSFLGARDHLQVAKTSHHWRVLCEDDSLWHQRCLKIGIEQHLNLDDDLNKELLRSTWKKTFLVVHNWQFKDIEPKVIKGHDNYRITSLGFCGDFFVSTSYNMLRVWSAITGKFLRTLVGHTDRVLCSQTTRNTIISGSKDGTLRVWDVDTGDCLRTLTGHSSHVLCLALNDRKVVSGSLDFNLRLWDIDSGECLCLLVGHVRHVTCVQYNSQYIVSGANDRLVKVWDPDTGECLHTLRGHTRHVLSLQFNGTHIVSGSLDHSIRVWDVETGMCRHSLEGHQSKEDHLQLVDNTLAVTSYNEPVVKAWDINSGRCLQTLQVAKKQERAVCCLRISGKFLITGSCDGKIKLWDLTTGQFIRTLVKLDWIWKSILSPVFWKISCSPTKMVCAAFNNNKTKLMLLNFDTEEL